MKRNKRPPLIIPMQALNPVHTYAGLIRPLDHVRRFPEGVEVTEWLGGEPCTVIRWCTEARVPVPFPAADWELFEALLGGDE